MSDERPERYPEDDQCSAAAAPMPRMFGAEWADSDELQRCVVTQPVVSPEGRSWRVGDRISANEARRLRIPVVVAPDIHVEHK